jgi:hypothetical protein
VTRQHLYALIRETREANQKKLELEKVIELNKAEIKLGMSELGLDTVQVDNVPAALSQVPRKSLDRMKLMQAGVSADVLDKCTVVNWSTKLSLVPPGKRGKEDN